MTSTQTKPGSGTEPQAETGAEDRAETRTEAGDPAETRAQAPAGTRPPARPRSVAEPVTEPKSAPVPDPGSEPGPSSPEAVIAGHRERIDDLDVRIIALVRERMGVSAQIQRVRVEAGGRRVNLSREMEILNRYSDSLGKPGTALAMTLLELCRGRA